MALMQVLARRCWWAWALSIVLLGAAAARAQPAVVTSLADGPGNGVYAFASSTPKTLGELMQGGKEALDAAGIEIPFPHQVEISAKDAKPARDAATPAEQED